MAVYCKYLLRSVLFWIGAVLAFVGLIMAMSGWSRIDEAMRLRRNGQDTEGKVLDVRTGSRLRILRFSFRDAQGNEQTHEASIQSGREFRPGDTVRVLFHRERPWLSVLPDLEEETRSTWGLVWSGLGILALGLLSYSGAHRRAARAMRLFRRGVIVEGKVVAVQSDLQTTINNRHPKFLRFTFVAAEDGKTYTGKSQNLPFRVEGQWRTGGPVTIAYNPRNPTEHEPDIFGFARGKRGA